MAFVAFRLETSQLFYQYVGIHPSKKYSNLQNLNVIEKTISVKKCKFITLVIIEIIDLNK